MTEQERNKALARSFYEALARGDMDAVVDAYAKDGVCRIMGHTLISGTMSKQQIATGGKAIVETFPKGLSFTILRMTAEDSYRCDARRILWNVMALRAGDRTFPLIYDFDVSGMVAGRHLWFGDVYNEAFIPSKSHPEIEVLGQLQRTRALFTRDVLDAARKRFIERKAGAYDAL